MLLKGRPKPPTRNTGMSSSWDTVEDLPLRWATDFEPFHHPKVANTNILFFELWKSDENGNYGRTMLAIGTPKSIVLFEAPRGERAFTYVKDYYTPHPAKSAKFIYQAVPDPRIQPQYHTLSSSRSKESLLSDHGSVKSGQIRRISQPGLPATPQLSLFLTFEKKAVVVRLSDAAVGEVDVYQDPTASSADLSPTHSLTNNHGAKLHKHNSEAAREGRSMWAPLVQLYLPVPPQSATSSQSYVPSERLYYLITRGKHTYAYPTPLPIPVSLSQASYVYTWTAPPTQIAGRVVRGSDGSASLQLSGFGEGVEIVEIPVADIIAGQKDRSIGRAAGKVRSDSGEARRTFVHEGFTTGYLCSGGEWDKMSVTGNAWRSSFARPILHRSMSDMSIEERSRVSDAGVYAWIQKDIEDYRVFWLGSKDAVDI